MAKQSASMLLWNEPWFRKLPAPYKLAWKFLVDHANSCGIAFVDTEYWMFMLGIKDGMNWDKFFEAVGDKIHRLSATEIWIPQVINERCGAITWDCRAHRPVIDFLKRYGLTTDQRIHVVKLEPAEIDLAEIESKRGKGTNTLSVVGESKEPVPEKLTENPVEKPVKPKRPRNKKVVPAQPPPESKPPTLEEVEKYVRDNDLWVNAKDFFMRYSNTNWYKGGPGNWEPIKNWKNTLLTISRSNEKEGNNPNDFKSSIREQMAKVKEEQNKPEPRRKPLLGGASA